MNESKNNKKNAPLNTHGGLWILIVAAIILEGIACLQYFYGRSAIRAEAEERAKAELRRAELEIEKHAVEMEAAAKMMAMLAEKYVDQPDSMYTITRSIVGTIGNTTSVAIAFVPNYFPREGRYFEICSSRITEDSIYTRQIGSAEHDYTCMEWFQNGFVHDSCWWCEPYLDDSGSRTYVVSCSYPVHDRAGEVVGVVCVDLALDYLQQLSEYLQIYPGSYYSIRSSQGLDITAKPDTVAGRKYEIFDREIQATGWSISIIIPDDEIYKELRKVGLIVILMMVLGLVVLVFMLYRTGKSLVAVVNLTNQKEHIESELSIARSIQMAMLPTRFPPFPDYPNLSAYGMVEPAREVGGDLYDFYIREGKLFFCIGDVSGKGMPAALVMAVTRSLFRSFTSYINSPAQIVTQMNNTLSDESNDMNMFVTLFLGILDLQTGELLYCNAGHDAPILMPKGQAPLVPLECVPNLPMGVLAGFEFAEQKAQMGVGDMLFLYTDGLTEAENAVHAQFGDQRMAERLEAMREQQPDEVIRGMQSAVVQFVNGAPQSDDLTMFAVRFLNKRNQPTAVSHHSLVMRNDIQQIPTLAEWIDSIGLPKELNMPLNLALEEAVSNVMLYAYPDTNSGRVLVEAEKTPKQVTFIISDSGIPFDPTKQEEPDITQSAEERPIGGLGIFLVRQIMDIVGYERKNDRNILTLVKRL